MGASQSGRLTELFDAATSDGKDVYAIKTNPHGSEENAYWNLVKAFKKFDKNGDKTILTKDLGKKKHHFFMYCFQSTFWHH